MAHLVLDVNETLSDMAPIGACLERRGASSGAAAAWFAAVLRDGFALSLHERAPAFLDLARQDLRRTLLGGPRLDAPVEEVVDEALEVLAGLGVHPDVVPGVRALVDAGHRVSALSNGSAAATRGLLQRAGVLDAFTAVLSVEAAGGVWKPHPRAYAVATDALGVAAGDLVMVAVHPWDLDGAARAGLRTAWLDRDGSRWPESFTAPDRRVVALGDLATAA